MVLVLAWNVPIRKHFLYNRRRAMIPRKLTLALTSTPSSYQRVLYHSTIIFAFVEFCITNGESERHVAPSIPEVFRAFISDRETNEKCPQQRKNVYMPVL